MGKSKRDVKSRPEFAVPSTPLTPAQAESRRILSNMPDPNPVDGINYEWSMKDLQSWTQAEKELKDKAAMGPSFEIKKPPNGPATFGGRPWWSAAARLGSIIVLVVAIIAEALTVLSDASARTTQLPDLAPSGPEDESTTLVEERVRLARYAVRLVRRTSKDAGLDQENFPQAMMGETNPVCQWVNNTDVQNNAIGVPLAVSYHMFTALILVILVMAEFKIWTYRLHPSSTLNIGIIQAWAGLASLSRSVNDTFAKIAAGALMVAGLGNILFGFLDRWTAGGPGFMFFGTGVAPAKQALLAAEASSNAPATPKYEKKDKKRVMPPDPTQELFESEKIASSVYLDHTSTSPDLGTLGTTGLLEREQLQGFASPPGIDMQPILADLAATNRSAYREILKQLALREEEEQYSRSPLVDVEEETKPLRVHFDGSRQDRSSSRKAGKKWKNRMSHDI